jgi:hypothetical protein
LYKAESDRQRLNDKWIKLTAKQKVEEKANKAVKTEEGNKELMKKELEIAKKKMEFLERENKYLKEQVSQTGSNTNHKEHSKEFKVL